MQMWRVGGEARELARGLNRSYVDGLKVTFSALLEGWYLELVCAQCWLFLMAILTPLQELSETSKAVMKSSLDLFNPTFR